MTESDAPAARTDGSRRGRPHWQPSDQDVVNARFGLLLLLLLAIFLIEGFSTDVSELIVVLLVLVLVVATFRLTAVTANLPTFAVLVGLALFALVVGAVTEPLDGWRAVGYLALFVLLTSLGFALLVGVLRQQQVDAQTVMGAIATYVLAGLAFSWLFQAIAVWDPDQFNMEPDDSAQFSEFSFITLTTVGFGNDHPTGALGGRVVVLEALFAQLFLATFIARLVSLYGRRRSDEAMTERARDEAAERIDDGD